MATKKKKLYTLNNEQDVQKLSRRQFVQASIAISTASQSLIACDETTTPRSEMNGGEEAGIMAGDNAGQEAGGQAGNRAGQEAGMMAGEEAGLMAGDGAGELAGDMAGEMLAGDMADLDVLPEPLPPPILSPDPEPVSWFKYGVASGDPQQTSLILWTMLDTELARTRLQDLGVDQSNLEVSYELSDFADESFETPIQSGVIETNEDQGFSVKIKVSSLDADTRYRYRFFISDLGDINGEQEVSIYSHIGETRTLPVNADEIKIAVCSCANFSSGYFHIYRHISIQEDLNVVLHLGDYIYESASLGEEFGRTLASPVEARDIPTYRARYAEYKLDPDLQALHRKHPMIAVWDDHEFDNNANAEDSSSSSGEAWTLRKQEAKQVYHEWMPTAVTVNEALYRRFNLGGIADLFMLDTRIEARSPQLTRAQFRQRFDENRKLLGNQQETWLHNGLSQSTAPWKILGQQVMMSPLQLRGSLESERDTAILLNTDSWDGYAADRSRLFEHIQQQDIEGVVVLTGDIHTSWAAELSINPNDPMYYEPNPPETGDNFDNPKGALAVEFVTPSVTSRSLPLINDTIINALNAANPHFKWYELTRKGFLKLILNQEELSAQWCLVESVAEDSIPGLIYAKELRCTSSKPGLMRLMEVES